MKISLRSHSSALDWFTPAPMQSRIEIFKEAANEVLDWTPVINDNIQHLLHWPSLARQFSGWLVPNVCIISRATLSISASQNTTATVRISSRPGGSEAEMLELVVCLVYDPDIIKTMWHLTPNCPSQGESLLAISHFPPPSSETRAGSWELDKPPQEFNSRLWTEQYLAECSKSTPNMQN